MTENHLIDLNDLIEKLEVEDKNIYKTDNIGIITFLTNKFTNETLCLASTHLFWNPIFPQV